MAGRNLVDFFKALLPKLLPYFRSMLFRASAHLISNAPLIVILSEAKKVIKNNKLHFMAPFEYLGPHSCDITIKFLQLMPVLLDGLSLLSEDILDKDKLYSLLLVLSGILTDKNGNANCVSAGCIFVNIIYISLHGLAKLNM